MRSFYCLANLPNGEMSASASPRKSLALLPLYDPPPSATPPTPHILAAHVCPSVLLAPCKCYGWLQLLRKPWDLQDLQCLLVIPSACSDVGLSQPQSTCAVLHAGMRCREHAAVAGAAERGIARGKGSSCAREDGTFSREAAVAGI